MMVALLLYSYAVGERSSRRIERRCVEDVASRVICANRAPDHTTIARFRQRHEDALAELFGEVLWLCAEAGLVRVGVVAVDGTKVQANASHHASRDYEQIAREILEHADAVDAEEDERFGDARGDELPEQLSTPEGRQRWLRDARRRLDERRARQARPIPRPRPKRLKEAAATAGCATGGGSVRTARRSPTSRRSARRARSTSATWTRAMSRRRAGGCRVTTPRPSRPPIRSSSPPR
jgi:hypothetical protein